MKENLNELIALGEQVLAAETQPNSGIPYPSTVSGPLTKEWKERCKVFFLAYKSGCADYERANKILSARVMTLKQARDLLELLKSWNDNL